MSEHMFIFVNKSPFTVLEFLIENGRDLHVREIARKTKLSLGFVSRVLNQFLKDDLISVQHKGRMKLYGIIDDNPIIKQVKILITVTRLYPLIKRISTISHRIIMFGSASRGENTPDSDIDLCVIANDRQKIRIRTRNFPDVVPLIMSNAEFHRLRKKDTALYEQINRGFILWEKSE